VDSVWSFTLADLVTLFLSDLPRPPLPPLPPAAGAILLSWLLVGNLLSCGARGPAPGAREGRRRGGRTQSPSKATHDCPRPPKHGPWRASPPTIYPTHPPNLSKMAKTPSVGKKAVSRARGTCEQLSPSPRPRSNPSPASLSLPPPRRPLPLARILLSCLALVSLPPPRP